jgi:hypothetical protein
MTNRIAVCLATVACLAAAACADPVDDLDRTQANRVQKSWFQGEWYYMTTVVDVPYTSSFTAVGEQQDEPMDRITWDIQEKYLYAFRSREFVPGTEIGRVPKTGSYQGPPLAVFEIDSHFDVIREYNAATGEQGNVIVENDEDRRWYERDYMRVLWGANLVNDYEFFGAFGPINTVSLTDPSSYLDEASFDNPDQTILTPSYMDVVTRLFVEPQLVCDDWNDDGIFSEEECDPSCWWSYLSDCAGAEIRMRHSFMKVGNRDYETRNYDDHEMEKFGYFRTERYHYDDRRGLTDADRTYKINRWDMWQRDHSETRCDTDADCGDEHGVACDPVVKRCSLAYSVREVKPIVYHTNVEFPDEWVDQGEAIFASWNRIFQEIVNHLRYSAEWKLACLPGEEGGGNCCLQDEIAAGQDGCVPNVVVLKPNDCNANNVNRFVNSVPGMRELRDRITGGSPPEGLDELKRVCAALEHATLLETDGRRAFRWQRLGDLRYSMLYWVDAPNDANGLGYGPSASDPLTGEIVAATAAIYGAEMKAFATNGLDVVRILNGELDESDFLNGVHVRDYLSSLATAEASAERRRRSTPGERAQRFSDKVDAQGGGGAGADARGRADGRKRRAALTREEALRRRELIKGTPLEAKLMPKSAKLLLGRTPATMGDPLSSVEQAKLSPLEARHGRRQARRTAGMRRAMRKTFYLREFADDAVWGYAQNLKDLDSEEAWREIVRAIIRSVAEHEVGHTLGLRHNFAGSADPLNYFKKYWDLRCHPCDGEDCPPPPDGSEDKECPPPEPFAEHTEKQMLGEMPQQQYASIMDYGANFYSDIEGIGEYEKAAIAFGYGRLSRVFKSIHARLDGRMEEGETPGDVLSSVHYTRFPEMFGDSVDAMYDRTWVPAGSRPRFEVPIKFCSDEYEGALVDCALWDRGADAFEMARYAADSYRAYSVFEAVKRERPDESVDPWYYMGRIHERYFSVLTRLYQHWYYDDEGGRWRTSADKGAALTLATEEAVRLFWEILSTPRTGNFCWDSIDGYYNPSDFYFDCEAETESLSLGRGKPTDVIFDGDAGYYWFEKLQYIGSFYDKAAAMDAMALPDTTFIGVDHTSNADAVSFTFFDGFPELMLRLFGGLMTETHSWYAPRVVDRDTTVLSLDPAAMNAGANDLPGGWCRVAEGTPGSANPDCSAGNPAAAADPDIELEPVEAGCGVEWDPPLDIAEGDLVISEIHVNPEGEDAGVEWFEITNTSGAALNLFGTVISDEWWDCWQIDDDVELGAGDSITLGSLKDGERTGIDVDYGYPFESFELENIGDAVVLTANGEIVDAVRYGNAPGLHRAPSEIVAFDPFADGGGDAEFAASKPVYPDTDFNISNWAAWDAMLFFTYAWDQRFNDGVRIYIKGSGEDSTPALGAEEVVFNDPFSGRVYAALRYDDRFASPAWQLISDLAELADRWEYEDDADLKEYWESLMRYKIDLADLYRGLYDLLGKST